MLSCAAAMISRRQLLGGALAVAGLSAVRCAPVLPGAQEPGPPLAQAGGTLRVIITGDLLHVDPHSPLPASQLAAGLMYSRLLRPRVGMSAGYDSSDLVEDLAEKWEQADEVTHIFYIRRGVRWQDIAPVNGRELTAEDVKASLERLAALRTSAPSPALTAIEHIELPDRYTAKVTLREPMASFVTAVAGAAARIAPVELLEHEAEIRRIAVGTGPFLMQQPVRESRLVLRKNPAYFRVGQPYLDAIEIIFAPDHSTEMALLKSNEADLGPEPVGMLPIDGDALRSANSEILVQRIQRPMTYLLGFNTTNPPFNDVRARLAVSGALDRRRIGSDAYGESLQLSGHLPPSLVNWALSPDEIEHLWGKRDLARSKQIWTEAVPVTPAALDLLVYPQADQLNMVEHIVDQCRELGLRVRPLRLEGVAFTKALAERAFDLVLLAPPASTEPDDWGAALYLSTSPRNIFGFNDRYFDELAVRTRRAADPVIRRKAFVDLQQYLADKVPATPLFSPEHAYARISNLFGWAPHWSAGLPSIDEAWLYHPKNEPTPRPRG